MSFNSMIAVIGGTGKSGKFVVRHLINNNIPFRLLSRSTTVYNLPSSHVVHGDVRDVATVRRLCLGCKAIISTLGQSKGESPVFSLATRNVLATMQALDINRYVLTTGLNVDTPMDKKGSITQAGTNWMRENYPATTADKQLEYELLAASNVDWTLVRLPFIGMTEDTDAVAVSLQDCPGKGIHGRDLAQFLIEQIDNDQYVKQAPFLANLPDPEKLFA